MNVRYYYKYKVFWIDGMGGLSTGVWSCKIFFVKKEAINWAREKRNYAKIADIPVEPYVLQTFGYAEGSDLLDEPLEHIPDKIIKKYGLNTGRLGSSFIKKIKY